MQRRKNSDEITREPTIMVSGSQALPDPKTEACEVGGLNSNKLR